MESFNRIGELTEVLSFVPFALFLFYFLANDEKTKKRLGAVIIVSWCILFAIHTVRYYNLYTTVGLVEFPFPLIVYPGIIIGWYVMIFEKARWQSG